MKKMIFIFCFILISFYVYAQQPTQQQSQSQQQQKVLTEEELKKIDPKQIERQKIERKTGGEAPREERIEIIEAERTQQEIIIRKYKPNILFIESGGFKMGTPLSAPIQNDKEKQLQAQKQETKSKSDSVEIGFKGYCETTDSYKLSIYPIPVTMNCLIKDLSNEFIKLTGRFKPEVGAHLGLLLDNPKLHFQSCQLKEFNIVRADNYAPYLYSDVDRKVWENALLQTLTKTGQDVATGASERLKQPSKKTVILSESGVTIVDEQTEKDWKEFRKSIPYMAGANLIDAVSRELLSTYGGRIPPIFYVEKGELYYVEGICTFNKN